MSSPRPETPLDHARALMARGYRVVPVPYRQKGPVLRGWHTLVIADEDLPRYFNGMPQNVGGLMGEPSGGLLDVDIDAPEAGAIASVFLAPTDALFGRQSCPRSHWAYRVTSGAVPRRKVFTDPALPDDDARAVLVEVRGTGHQTVMPGSVHPCGEVVRWDQDGEPGSVDGDDLVRRVAILAAAALLARYWPKGSRHDVALALAGALLRHGWSARHAEAFVGAVARAARDDEEADRRAAVQTTAVRLAAGESVVGIPRLRELLDTRIVDRMLTWLRLESPATERPADAAGASESGERVASSTTPRYHLTDLGNSERLVAQHGNDLRYVYDWARWLAWDGARWRADLPDVVVKHAKATVRAIYAEAAGETEEAPRKAIAAWARASESHARITAMLALAQSELAIRADDLDSDPWLLNCENGTLDLRTGVLRAHERADFLTKLAPVAYDKHAWCPHWLEFLATITGESAALETFLQRAVGYSLTGDTSERVLFIAHGTGRNGKSTFMETVARMLGDYARRTPTETLMARREAGIPNDVAALKGARLVHASETEEGRRLAESFIKDLTGGDTMSARFLHGEFFDFTPVLKLWLRTNHKPDIHGTDNAIWDRVRLIPFTVRIEKEIPRRELDRRFTAEMPGILTWAVAGCLDWLRDGLGVPDEVRSATDAYRAESDHMGDFLDECCVEVTHARAKAGDLYARYKTYATDQGERHILTQKAFGTRLRERGFVNDRTRAGYVWLGLGLLADDTTPDPDPGPDRDEGDPVNHSPSVNDCEPFSPILATREIEGEKTTKTVHNGSPSPNGSQDPPASPGLGGNPPFCARCGHPKTWYQVEWVCDACFPGADSPVWREGGR